MNIRFGLYLIPEDSDFYQRGSSIVGYDVRNQQKITLPAFIEPAWVATNSQFGFHATITDAITIDDQELPSIADKTEQLLACLNPENRYILSKERVGFWRSTDNIAALLMTPNRNIEMLHNVLVTALHPLGKGSEYFDSYMHDKVGFTPNSPASIKKVEEFYSPFIFDEFVPHFTCINSYNGPVEKRAVVEAGLQQLFADVQDVEFTKIALVTQAMDEPYFRIVREFSLCGPQ